LIRVNPQGPPHGVNDDELLDLLKELQIIIQLAETVNGSMFRAGFGSLSQFERVFKQRTECTPKVYRSTSGN
jgi:AraC-like DNA-binding protein